jgi:hypothetical protein
MKEGPALNNSWIRSLNFSTRGSRKDIIIQDCAISILKIHYGMIKKNQMNE